MKNDQNLHVTGIKCPTPNGKGIEVYLRKDSFDLISAAFAAKRFNKEAKEKGTGERMESPLHFETGQSEDQKKAQAADADKKDGTYVFSFNNAVLYVQFENTDEDQKDAKGNLVINSKTGTPFKKTNRLHILTPKDAEELVTPVVIPV